MSRATCLAAIICFSVANAADIPERFAKRIESAEVTYKTAVLKADNIHAIALMKANYERNRVLAAILEDATKVGDFDTATDIKSRMADPKLADDILDIEWEGSHTWGTFAFRPDGTVSRERIDTPCQWVPIDNDSVLTIIRNGSKVYVDRLIFNKERNKVVAYGIGNQGGAFWEAKRVAK